MEKGKVSQKGGGRLRRKEAIGPKGESLKVTKKVLKSEVKLRELYEKWYKVNRRSSTEEEKETRFEYFKQTASLVRKLNQEHPSGGAGLTCYADWSPEEDREKRSS